MKGLFKKKSGMDVTIYEPSYSEIGLTDSLNKPFKFIEPKIILTLWSSLKKLLIYQAVTKTAYNLLCVYVGLPYGYQGYMLNVSMDSHTMYLIVQSLFDDR